jgi:hypothetical protein
MNDKQYLGDGVYATFDGYHIWLTTENGISTTNEIALGPQALRLLREYVARIEGAANAPVPNARELPQVSNRP